MSTETFTRKIPNILKNNQKLQKVVETTSSDTNRVFINVKENAQNSFNQTTTLNSLFSSSESLSPEKKCIKKGNKHRRSFHRRKQEHSFTDVWQESLNWNMYSFMDDKRGSKACMKRKSSRYLLEKQNEKCKMPVFNIVKQKENILSSQDTSTEFMSEYDDISFLENPIDFSSNEIFSNFNYKFQDVNEITSFTEYTMDSDKLFNSFNTMCDSKIYEKGYDIHDNEVNVHKLQYSTSTDYENKDMQLLYDKEPNCSSDCCNYCLEDCASHWIATSELKNITSMKDRVNNEINYQRNIGCSNVCILETDVHSTADTLKEDYDEDNLYWQTTFTSETSSLCKLQNTNSSCMDICNCYNQKDIKVEILEDLTTIKSKECDACIDANNNIPIKFDTDVVTHKTDENIEMKYEEKALQDQKYSDTIDEEFQCLLCLLTFFSARTLAIHHAAAHGGTYIILCECCGRLFNRKYHFNRHFIHCGRLKEPYKCDMCMKTYRHRSSLVHHLKICHDVHYARSHSKTFTCSICKKIYSKLGAFENHVKGHKNK